MKTCFGAAGPNERAYKIGWKHQIGSVSAAARPGQGAVSYTHLDVYKRQESDWSPVDLWVLDHPKWPLLMKLDFGGECELSLFEIKPVS